MDSDWETWSSLAREQLEALKLYTQEHPLLAVLTAVTVTLAALLWQKCRARPKKKSEASRMFNSQLYLHTYTNTCVSICFDL